MKPEEINNALDETKTVVDDTSKLIDEIESAKNTNTPISTATVTSLVISLIVVINTVLAILGVDKQLTQNYAYQIGTILALVANVAYTTWKNHNITSDARKRQAVGDVVIPKDTKGK